MMKEVEEVEQVARDFESDLQELPPDQLKIKYLSRKGLVSKLLEKIRRYHLSSVGILVSTSMI